MKQFTSVYDVENIDELLKTALEINIHLPWVNLSFTRVPINIMAQKK